MGLEKRRSQSVKFVNVNNGNLTVRVTKETPEAVERILTATGYEGKVIHELQYGNLRGYITKLEHASSDMGKRVEITIQAEEINILQLSWKANYTGKIIEQLPNVDYSEEVNFRVFLDTKGKKPKNVLLIYQGKDEKGKEKYVSRAYTKDNPNGMPPAIQEEVMGELKWDFSEVEKFLYNVLQTQAKKVEKLNKQKDVDDDNLSAAELVDCKGVVDNDPEMPF